MQKIVQTITCGSSQRFLVLAGRKANEQKQEFPLREKKMAEIKLREGLYRNNFNFCGCAGVAATGATRRAHHFTQEKEILLLADSNYITWRPPCCLLSRPPGLGNLHTLKKNFFLAGSLCADMGTNDTGILQWSVRSVEPVCFATRLSST